MSKTVQVSCIVSDSGEEEVIHAVSNGDIADDLGQPKSLPLFLPLGGCKVLQ